MTLSVATGDYFRKDLEFPQNKKEFGILGEGMSLAVWVRGLDATITIPLRYKHDKWLVHQKQ